MLRKLFEKASIADKNSHTEGELYKKVCTFGRTFELRYGYYAECDRESPLCEPIPIYPDFLKDPQYTDGGEPFVTVMQDTCDNYEGNTSPTPDTTCSECKHFLQGEEWFGICKCPMNQMHKNE